MKPHRNHGLFSNYYLDELLSREEEFRVSRPELKETFQAIKSLWDKDRLSSLNEPQLRKHFLDKVFDSLGWTVDVEPPTLSGEWSRHPDYALFEDLESLSIAQKATEDEYFKKALCLGEAKRWGRPLDKKLKTETDPSEIQNPSLQMSRYLWLTGVRWGILTDGRYWRLYEREISKRLDIFYEIDLEDLIENGSEDDFKYFYLFFRRDAFPDFLEKVYEESVDYAQAVGEELKENVYQALKTLAEGFLKTSGNNIREVYLKEIHDNSLILLYRLLFILYAEYGGLLPLGANRFYTESYSLDTLKKEIAQKLDRNDPIATSTFRYWNRLKELFETINRGNPELEVPPYNGGLFDPDKHIFLEDYRVGDLYIARAVDLLSRSSDKAYIDYGSLEIRHLGSIYEGLLEYKLAIAEEDIVPIKEKSRDIFVPLEEARKQKKKIKEDEIVQEGEVYLVTDKGERKATGSYYTPHYIVKYIVENTLGPLIEGKKKKVQGKVSELEKKLKASRGYNRQACEKELEKTKNSIIDEILSIKVLDPAMGSGHFLVVAADFLAKALVDGLSGTLLESTEEAEAIKEAPDEYVAGQDEDDIRWARREVVERCIFGVDSNPLAVELAKLSLWLATVAKDRPLSFLDHHLRCGNSLIGAQVENLATLGTIKTKKGKTEAKETEQLILFDESAFKLDMGRAVKDFHFIEAKASDTVDDIRAKERIYKELWQARLEKWKRVADLWSSAYFGNELDRTLYQALMDRLLGKPSSVTEGVVKPYLEKAEQLAEQKRFFHWEIEFPEIFYDEYGRKLDSPGFDVVVGNPPYIDSEEMTRSLPELREYCDKVGYKAASGNWDIFCIFIERGVALTKERGFFSMIVPNKLLAADYALVPQQILGAYTLERLRDYSRVKVFPISVYPIVFVVRKTIPDGSHIIQIEVLKETSFSKVPVQSFENRVDWETFQKLPEGLWSPLVRKNFSILEKVLNVSLPLSKYCNIVGAATVSEAYKLEHYIEEFQEELFSEDFFMFINTGAIDRYEFLWGIDDVTYLKKRYRRPIIRKFDLLEISSKRFDEAKSEKVIIAGMTLRLEAMHDNGICLAGKSTVLLLPEDINLKFLMSCIDSKLASFAYRELFESLSLQGGYLRIGPPQVERIPIRRISFTTPEGERESLVADLRDKYQNLRFDELLAAVDELLPKDKEGKFITEKEKSDVVHDLLAFLAEQMIEMNKEKQREIKGFLGWLETQLKIQPDNKGNTGIEALTNKTSIKNYLGDYQKGEEHLPFDEFWKILEKNKVKIRTNLQSRELYQRVKEEYEKSLAKLLPLKQKLKKTDWLIDQIVYKLYGLAEEEIEIVEGRK